MANIPASSRVWVLPEIHAADGFGPWRIRGRDSNPTYLNRDTYPPGGGTLNFSMVGGSTPVGLPLLAVLARAIAAEISDT